MLAEESFDEARELNEVNNCKESTAMATDALRLYGEALRLAEKVSVKDPEEDPCEKEIQKTLELKDVLERLYCYLERIRENSEKFEEEGFDVSEVETLIGEAVELLERAEELLSEGKFDEVRVHASRVKDLLNHAMELVQKINEVNKIEKARRFLIETENRLGVMEERITNVLSNLGVSGQVLEAVGSVFLEARAGIEEVQTLLETGEFRTAIHEFKEVFEETQEGLNLVNEFDGDRREFLDRIEKLEAEIGYLAENIEALRDSGIDVSELIFKIGRAKSLIQTIVLKLEEGNLDKAETLVNEVVGFIKYIKEEIARFRNKIQTANSINDTNLVIIKGETVSETLTADENIRMTLKHINELEERIRHLTEKIEKLKSEDYDIEEFIHILEKAKNMLESSLGYLNRGEVDLSKKTLSELVMLLEHLEKAVLEAWETGNIEYPTTEEKPVDSVIGVTEESPCSEEEIIAYKVRIDELEGKIAHLAETVDCLGESALRLIPYTEISWKYFHELLDIDPCSDNTYRIMIELEELLSFIETEAKIIQEEVETVCTETEEAEPPREVWYYALEIGGELCGKFEFKVVTINDIDSRIVFEEGISVNWSGVENIELFFESAIPLSWRGPELSSVTGEPHFIERLELAVAYLEFH
jgi:tetratricopeptide (TPR) repeat protein